MADIFERAKVALGMGAREGEPGSAREGTPGSAREGARKSAPGGAHERASAGGRRDWLIAAAFFLAAILTRVNFRSRWLYSWDSANFALGLLRFSPRDHQPHPPGYPLYIAAGRLVDFFIADPNGSLVIVSIFCGALAVALIYWVGARIFDRTTGTIAAWLLLFSPLVWFQSEVALSYIVELPFTIMLCWLFYELIWHQRFALVSAAVLGIAAGFRQDVFFLLPVLLFGLFRLNNRRLLLYSLVALALSVTVWLLPLMYLVGGVSAYRGLSSAQFASAFSGSAFWNVGLKGVSSNLLEAWRSLLWLFGIPVLGFVLAWAQAVRMKSEGLDHRVLLLLIMPAPALVFFIATGFGHPGYALVYAGPLVLILARCVANLSLAKIVRGKGAVKGTAAGYPFLLTFLLLGAAVNAALFLDTDRFGWSIPTTGGTISSVYSRVSWAGIQNADDRLSGWTGLVSGNDPDSTLVVSVSPNDDGPFGSYSRQLVYYLPDYRLVWLTLDGSDTPHEFQKRRELFNSNVQGRDVTAPATVRKVIIIGLQPSELQSALKPSQLQDFPIPVSAGEFPRFGTFSIGPYSFHH